MKYSKIFAALAIAVVAVTSVACSSTSTRESTGQYIDSSVITTKVKAELAAADALKSYTINVETFKDVVQLSGFVDNGADKASAGNIAAGVEGVDYVRNNIVVK